MVQLNRGSLTAGFIIFITIVSLAFAIPILVFGFAAIIKVISLMNNPIVEGQIPVWAIFVAGITILYLYRKYKESKFASRGY